MSRGRSIGRSGGRSSFGGSRSSSSFRSRSGRSFAPRPHRYSGNSSLGWFIAGSLFGRNNNSNNANNVNNNNVNTTQTQAVVKYKKVRNKLATIMWGTLFAIMCIAMIITAYNNSFAKVMATSTGYETEVYMGETYYFSNYEYEVDDQTYRATSGAGWTNLYAVGEDYEIYYLRSNPYEIYEVEYKGEMPSYNIIYIFLAIIFGIVAICIFVFGINKYEVDEEYAKEQERIKANAVPAGKRRCLYCGTINDIKETNCSSCGAPLK